MLTATEESIAAAWFLRGFFAGIQTDRRKVIAKYPNPFERELSTANQISVGLRVYSPLDIYDMVAAARKLGLPPMKVTQ